MSDSLDSIVSSINFDSRSFIKNIIYSNAKAFGNQATGVVFTVSFSASETFNDFSKCYKITSIEHAIEILESLSSMDFKDSVRQRVLNIDKNSLENLNKDLYLVCSFRRKHNY